MLNVAVAEIGLQASGINAVIRQLVPTGMPQHVRMDAKAEAGSFAQPSD
jgi:hypothetical protein